MNPHDGLYFEPPEHGLLPGESVIWSKPSGISFTTIFCGGCLPLLAVIPGLFVLVFFGELIGYVFYGLILVGFIWTLRTFFIQRGTVYYLTTERVILVIHHQIIQAILLDHLEGQPSESVFHKHQTATENSSPVYKIRIVDPKASLVIELNNVTDDIAEVLEKLGESVTCPKCGHTTVAVRKRCKKCDARLG